MAQGATEFLADGRARMTMFETANVSTWIHELAHIALSDLDPADLAIAREGDRRRAQAGRVDGGRQREAYARSFETYMRDGYAHPALREMFAKITAWMHDALVRDRRRGRAGRAGDG